MTDRELNAAQNYFGKDTTIIVFKCKSCKEEDPVPDWLVSEMSGFFNKLRKKKYIPKMECPSCGKIMTPLKHFND